MLSYSWIKSNLIADGNTPSTTSCFLLLYAGLCFNHWQQWFDLHHDFLLFKHPQPHGGSSYSIFHSLLCLFLSWIAIMKRSCRQSMTFLPRILTSDSRIEDATCGVIRNCDGVGWVYEGTLRCPPLTSSLHCIPIQLYCHQLLFLVSPLTRLDS